MIFKKLFHYSQIILIVAAIISGCTSNKLLIAVIQTEIGDIKIELYKDKAPVTVSNFMEYIDSEMYNEGEFYRVVRMDNQPNNNIKIEVIQGGLGWDDSIPRLDSIEHESTNVTGILHLNGTVSMARNQPGSASSEFFICIGTQPELDFGGKRNPDGQGFAAFGKVIDGMDVVYRIHQTKDTNQYLISPIKITAVSINLKSEGLSILAN